MPQPAPIDAALARELSAKRIGRELNANDVAAVVGLLNALETDMRAFRAAPIADGDEPATTYAAIEGEP